MTALRLHAAGSLRAALTEAVAAFRTEGGEEVETVFGASGLLRERIAAGEACDLFASANMAHPAALSRGRGVDCFARNRLCLVAAPGIEITADTLLDRMLDPALRLGTSTPGADPSGDYAFEVFARAEALRPGARAVLEAKALRLTGHPACAEPPAGRNTYAWLISEGQADLFLTYGTNARTVLAEVPGACALELPAALSVCAQYGLVVLSDRPGAARLGAFILGPGQAILAQHGFAPPAG